MSDCTPSFSSDYRAVSSTIGFMFTFAMVLFAVGILYSSGLGTFSDLQGDTRSENAVRAFDILSQNIEDVYRWGAPSRGTELKLTGGSLSLTSQQTSVNATVVNPNTGQSFTTTVHSRPFVYDSGVGTKAIYDGGLLVRSDRGRTSVVRGAPYLFTENRTALTLVQVEGQTQSRGGNTQVLVVTKRMSVRLVNHSAVLPSEDPITITMTVNGSQEVLRGWKQYFESEELTPIDDTVSDGQLVYQYTSNRVFVRVARIELGFNDIDSVK